MSGRSLTQREASNARKIAQVAAIAGAALALAALVFRLPGLGDAPAAPGPIQWPDIKPPADPQAGRPTPSRDMDAAASRLALVSNKPKPAAPQPEPTEVPNPEQTSSTEIKYLGAVLEPTRKIALLRVGERQRMIAEGKTVALADGGTLEVVTIDAEGVVIRDAQGERRVEKSARTASAVTTITDNAVGASAIMPSPDDAAESEGNEDMQRRRMEAEARMKALRDRTKAGGRNP